MYSTTTLCRWVTLPAILLLYLLPLAVFGQNCPTGVTVTGGTIALAEGGGDSTSVCAGDGIDDLIDVTLSGATGDSSIYVITDDSLNILALPAAPPFNLEGAGDGTCLIWHLSYTGDLGGAAIDGRADSLTGCFELSNSITVRRDGVDGGILSLATGGDSTAICADDSISDAFEVVLTDTVGTNSAWVITDDSLNILALPAGPPFDLDGAGPGLCYVWHLAYGDSLSGATVGANAADLAGCFDLSNQIFVTRDTGTNCATTALPPALEPGQVRMFPNPVTHTLSLDLSELSSGTTILEIMDASGRLLERRELGAANGRHTFDLSTAAAGPYLLRVRNDGRMLTRRFVKQ
ncbi:hypothetical protein LEM8419_00563 [Neolewinella maritima]|uniref:Secretion system C-terminal sorting domain-containing protein n=1 Tax=Neolewinella maritima TaxID=1383882 RepID=A0ABM9AX05_9BACT|nr:T9SS type A sorting domain-containing protein [Neolewinella maritima]CAH0999266.1 hypothetical protein LEM8419_00563 [Neolewinella maritima]